MKNLFALTCLLAIAGTGLAQQQLSFRYTEIKQAEYSRCAAASKLISNPAIKKQSGKISIPITGKAPKVFKDDTSVYTFHEFTYLGDIRGSKLALLQWMDYNKQKFYVVNKTTGTIDTLLSLPAFAANGKDFVCCNNPGTDQQQMIQIGEFVNNRLITKYHIEGKPDAFFEEITCVSSNALMAKDNTGRYWKLTFAGGVQ